MSHDISVIKVEQPLNYDGFGMPYDEPHLRELWERLHKHMPTPFAEDNKENKPATKVYVPLDRKDPQPDTQP